MLERPGQHFAWAEFEVTRTGIANTAPPEARARILALVAEVLDPLRRHVGAPLTVTSGYRSPEVNRSVGGTSTSDHLSGGAVDLRPPRGWDAERLARAVLALGLPFDQLIVYDAARGGHLHIGHRPGGGRRQTLRAPASGGTTRWEP
jgi:hypothetical protein